MGFAPIRRSLPCLVAMLMVLTTVSTPAARAQTITRYYSSAPTGNTISSTCLQEGAVLHPLIDAYPHPAQWTWIVACDEIAWGQLLKHLGVETTAGHQVFGETDRHYRTTTFAVSRW
jgi:hypothetical protein